jgi:hypothetical protein
MGYVDNAWLFIVDNAWLAVRMLITPAKVKQAHSVANVRATNLAGILGPFQQFLLYFVHLLTSGISPSPSNDLYRSGNTGCNA